MTIVTGRRTTTANFPSPDPAADFGPKFFISLAKRQGTPELAYLPWRQGPDCHLGKELAENLNDLSLCLRNRLRAATPAGAVRPDVDTLRRLMFAGHGAVKAAEWQKPAAIPALVQLLQVENTPLRLFLVELLAHIEGKEASEALAQRALFDLASEVREKAVQALSRRPFDEYQKVILAGFRYPWPAVADHAADALVAVKELAVKDDSVRVRMIELLGEPDPRLPVMVEAKGGKKVLAVRELVRINHMSNCMLCHAPSTSNKDLVRGRVPTPSEDPPPLYYAEQSPGDFVRADTTYLRQDFSVVQPVARSGKWPGEQRFDYLTRVRPLTKKERTEFEKQQKENRNPDIYEQKKSLLFAIRELTRKDLGFTHADGKPIVKEGALREDNASRQEKQP